jgi:F0F1-type ATP synthase membrane subunit b/b'
MERARWSDDRLDDRMSAIDKTFDGVFEELRAERAEFRAEMSAMRADLRAEMHGMRAELKAEMHGMRNELRGEMHGMRDELRAEMHDMRGELKGELREMRGDIAVLGGRVNRIEDRLVQIGFGMTGVLAAGLIALVATQI